MAISLIEIQMPLSFIFQLKCLLPYFSTASSQTCRLYAVSLKF